MGFSPRDVDQMSMWEFMACCDGFRVSKGGKVSEVESDRLRAMGIEGF